jgi:alginate O-acetyltransferase complex protein AlgI
VVFSSLRFFLFLALILALLAFPLGLRRKKMLLCAASCLFYAAWDYRYLALLLLISGIDFYCAARISLTENERARKAWVALSVVTNLGILGYFKYADFFLDSANGLILRAGGHELPLLRVFLPAGISFYTFKSMSYTIDVYRRAIKPVGSLLEYAMFVTFFPDLIAGPIVRASVFLPQLDREIGPTAARLRAGASRFLIGLGKKLLIADQCAVVADAVFASPATWSCFDAWCGLIAYSLQIYCDFSGYSDMAIGTAAMIGYDLPRNFRMPYLAANVADFWRRWHITLSEWLRDYLYIPLGGNRKGRARNYANLLVTMLLGGLWHGASWNFVLWGFLHGAALAVHRAWRAAFPTLRLPRMVATPITTLFVILCWVPFRAAKWETSRAMFATLFGLGDGVDRWLPVVLAWSLLLVIAGHVIGVAMEEGAMPSLFAAIDAEPRPDAISGTTLIFHSRTVLGAFVTAAIALTIYFFGAAETSPFIYFRF